MPRSVARRRRPAKSPTQATDPEAYPRAAAIFGANLSTARERSGISQIALAARSGKARGYISAVEAGRWNLTFSTAEVLANAVGVPLPDLLNPSWATQEGSEVRPSDIVPVKPGNLSIDLPADEAFVVARVCAERLKRNIPLIDPATRSVVAVVSRSPATG